MGHVFLTTAKVIQMKLNSAQVGFQISACVQI